MPNEADAFCAMQAALGRLLDAFVLCCPDDERLLKQLARQEGVQLPTTYITRFDIPQHDLSSRRPLPARVTTLLKVRPLGQSIRTREARRCSQRLTTGWP